MALLEIALRSYLDDFVFVGCTRLGYVWGSRLVSALSLCWDFLLLWFIVRGMESIEVPRF